MKVKNIIYVAAMFFTTLGFAQNSYKLQVGEIKIPLKMVTADNFNGRVELYKEEALSAISGTISIYNNGTPVLGKRLVLYYMPNKRDQSQGLISYTLDLDKDSKIPQEILNSIKDKLDVSDNITFQTVGEANGFAINSAALYIKDPNQPFKAPIFPQFNNDSEIFSWQLVGNLKKSLLKADTTVAANKSLVAIYKNKSKYDILHIPGYTTKQRYIKAGEDFWPADDVSSTINLSKLKTQPIYMYSEIAVAQEYSVSASWGSMNAAPISQNHSVQVWKENYGKPFNINVPSTAITLEQCELIIVPDRGEVFRVIAQKWDDPKLLDIFSKIEDRTTIYFQNILVKNDKGLVVHLPMVFGFLIANPPPAAATEQK